MLIDKSLAVADSGVVLISQSSDNIYYISGAFVQASNSPIINVIPSNLNKLKPTSKLVFLPGDGIPRAAGQCVGYVKYITGLPLSGNAIEWKKYINSQEPTVGSVVVMSIGRFGHLGIVKDIQDDVVTIRSRNWEGLWVISDNDFNTDDGRILGYINK